MNDISKTYQEISGSKGVGIVDENLSNDNFSNCLGTQLTKPNLGVRANANDQVGTDLSKKPPTAFIASADWGLYLRICCQIKQIHTNREIEQTHLDAAQMGFKNKRKSSCLIRLITAFNQLYAEYSRIYDLWKLEENKHANLRPKSIMSAKLTNDDERGSKTKLRLSTSSVIDSGDNHGKAGSALDNHSPVNHLSSRHPECSNQTDDKTSNQHELSRNQRRQSRQSLRSLTAERLAIQDYSTSGLTVANSASTSLRFSPVQSTGTSPQTSDQLSQSPMFPSDSEQGTCFRWCQPSDAKPPKSTAKYLSESSNNQHLKPGYCRQSNKSGRPGQAVDSVESYYDQIRRDPIENSILVYQTLSLQQKVEHRTQIYPQWQDHPKSKTNPVGELSVKMGQKTVTTLRLPIALELILPRMQNQIEQIMKTCHYIYDPLEVACELRETNYDTQACVAYFEKTRGLREIIEEFLPDSRPDRPDLGGPSQGSRRRFERLVETGSHNLRLCRSPLAGTVSNYLLDLRTQLNHLRIVQSDAVRRLERARILVLGMVDTIMQALLDKLKLAGHSASLITNRSLQGDMANVSYSHINQLTEENKLLKLTLKMEENRRKTIFNMMQEYLGNIRVYCRCRHIPNTMQCVHVCSLDTLVLNPGTDSQTEQFKFDRVFDGNAHQTDVYAELAPSICSFLDGYNVCFLTYGGEASGKTYTLLGLEDANEESHGLVYRSLRTILTEIEIRKAEWKYQLIVGVIEVYNDTLIDLLSDETNIHVRVDLGLKMMISRLTTMKIDKEADIDQLLNICRTRRRTGRTALNFKSSRSHLLILTELTAHNRIYDTEMDSVLAMCDLAGFEDIIKAETLTDPVLAKEAGYINRSLTALNRVFMTLRSQDPNSISYRDSKLTYLLKPFFTLSGKCILIATVRTDKASLASTQSTLRFGRDSRGVNLGRAKRQLNLDKLLDGIRAT